METKYVNTGAKVTETYNDLFSRVADIYTDITSDEETLIKKTRSVFNILYQKDLTFLNLLYEESMRSLEKNKDSFYTYNDDGNFVKDDSEEGTRFETIIIRTLISIQMTIFYKSYDYLFDDRCIITFDEMNEILRSICKFTEFCISLKSSAEVDPSTIYNEVKEYIIFKSNKFNEDEMTFFKYYIVSLSKTIYNFDFHSLVCDIFDSENIETLKEKLQMSSSTINHVKDVAYILTNKEEKKTRKRTDN